LVPVARNRTRIAQSSPEGLEIWDAPAGPTLVRDPSVKVTELNFDISPDGERIAWATTATARVRDLPSGQELQLPLDLVPCGRVWGELAAVTGLSFSLWDPAAG